ncbi:MAG: RNA pseudouridine synthase [Bacilli bacterium]|nr:RNA pseudouridine synthase [Bacilli bacterium]
MKKKLDIIHEDKELLVINKPSKLLTISTEKEKYHTLFYEASSYIKKQNPRNKIFIVHRLDKDTSGIVVFAKNESLKQALQINWDKLASVREYLAIVEGVIKEKEGTIKNYLKETKTLQVFDTKNPKEGKLAITNYQVLETNKVYSLLKINIKTGRKNQIRVALSSIGHPIVGDKKYQSQKNPYGRLALHASKLKLIHPKTNQEYLFLSKIPKEFERDFKNGIERYFK